MIRFLLISLLFLLQTSCALQMTKDWVRSEPTQEYIENSYFSELTTDYVYKAKINVYGHKFGGILIIKKLREEEHRVVFTTEFGNKLFDFLYQKNTFKKNFIVEYLDKKMIINTLQKDFKLLISEKAKVEGQYNIEDEIVFKTSDDKRSNFYFINKKTHTLDKIVNTSKSKQKVEVLYKEIIDGMANTIWINHHHINLQIELNKFAKK